MKKQYINSVQRESDAVHGVAHMLKRITPRRLCAGALALTCMLLLAGCPEDTGGSGGGPAGPAGPITNLSIIPQVNGVVQITWEDPTDSNFSHVLITWTPNPPNEPVRIEKGEGMATIMHLPRADEYIFSITTVSTSGEQTTTDDTMGSTAVANAPPSPATNPAAAPTVNGSVRVTWTDPTAPDFFHILLSWYKTSEGPVRPDGAPSRRVNPGEQTATVTGLIHGESYTFDIVSVDIAGGESMPAQKQTMGGPESVTATADTSAPDPVTLNADAGLNGRVEVTWADPVAPPDRIPRPAPENDNFSHIDLFWTPLVAGQAQPLRVNRGVGSAIVTGLTHAQTYTFTAVSVDTAGNRSDRSVVRPEAMATADTSTIGPVILTAVAGPDGDAVITWDDPPSDTFSHIMLSWIPDGGAQTSPLRVDAGAQTTTITELTHGTEYMFSAVSHTTSGDMSAASDTVAITADSVPPTPPVNFSSAARINGSIEISWDRAVGSSQTIISWSPVSTFAPQTPPLYFNSPVDLIKQFTTITGLTDGTIYTITARSIDAAGNISDSVTARVTANATPPAERANVMPTATVNTATVTWTEPTVSDFSHVLITWSPDDGSPEQPLRVDAGTTTATLINLESATEYTVTIQSVDTVGNTSTGITTTATTAAPLTTEVTDPAATIITADGSTTLTWTDPTDTTNAAMIVITGSPAPTTAVTVPIGTQTADISGLTAPGSDHVFTLFTQNSSGVTASSGVEVTARSAVNRPVALFQLEGTTHDGDFMYGACQTDLDDTDSDDNSNDAITTALRNAGYTKAVFFGRGSGYSLASIAIDDDALGFSGSTPTDTQLKNRNVVVYAAASPTETFGSPTAVSRTIDNVVNVNVNTGVWRNGGYDVVGSLVSGTFWSFDHLTGNNVSDCAGATSTTTNGIVGNSASVKGTSIFGYVDKQLCNNSYAVICAAH